MEIHHFLGEIRFARGLLKIFIIPSGPPILTGAQRWRSSASPGRAARLDKTVHRSEAEPRSAPRARHALAALLGHTAPVDTVDGAIATRGPRNTCHIAIAHLGTE